MPTLKLFQMSCPVFWGFNRHINIDNKTTIKECLDEFLVIHEAFLFQNNYIDLLNFFRSKKQDYHIHDCSFDIIRQTDDIIYVCRHENTHNDNVFR